MSQERSQPAFIAGILLLALLAYALGLGAMGYAQAALMTKFQLRLVLILSELALALPAVLVGLVLARVAPELRAFPPLSLATAMKTVVLGLAFWGLSLGVFEAQYVLVKPPLAYLQQFQGLHDLLRPKGPLDWVFSLCAIALAPALCEETLFRGLLTPVFRRAVGTMFAIVGSAAFFAAIHVDALTVSGQLVSVYYRVPFAFILGMLLAKVRLDTGSLWPPIIAHATLNATTFLVVIFAEEPTDVLPEPQPFVALGMLLVGAAVSRALMKQIRPAPAAP